ncbi:MAG: phoB 2 [Thermoleophilia bacterium]|nr:phoB 2 [Thermoleophilia bacterium]MCZ4497150.1 phoB 2 [Thermoleophilia bacterium]
MNDTVATADRSIVVIEDEEAIRDVIEWNLQREGFDVSTARDGRAGLDLVRSAAPQLVVLDLMLPELDGLDVCRAMRADAAMREIPVIMLTAKGDESDIVLGLGVGADDYVSKPFSPKELVARVQAVLRRNRGSVPAEENGAASEPEDTADPDQRRVELGGVIVDPARHEVLVDGVDVRLTRTELRLLHALLRSPGRVFSREQLVVRVMGDNAWVTDRTIDVHVRAVRRKLDTHAEVVETIRGVGYRARDPRD